MSRIHEALKKAELERSTSLTVADAAMPERSAVAEVEQDAVSHVAKMVPPAGNPARASNGVIRFEDLRAACSHPEWHPDLNSNVFTTGVSVYGAEQFRTLRTRLYQIRGNQRLQILLVTSAVAGEGKTFVTNNLALSLARQADRRVLLIDADLRRSRLHIPLGAPASPGLTDYLRGAASDVSVVQQGHENLCFIPGGSQASNPSELLSNGRFKVLLDRFASAFDWIIIDSPPCLPVADANLMADLCDGLLFVVRAGSTPSAIVKKAQQELEERNVVGVILNAVQEQSLGYSAYYQSDVTTLGDIQVSDK